MFIAKDNERIVDCLPPKKITTRGFGISNEDNIMTQKATSRHNSFIPNSIKGRRSRNTANKLIAHLQYIAAGLGHTPSCAEINNSGVFTHNMYISCFKSISKAQEAAGLIPNSRYNSHDYAKRRQDYVTKLDCINDLKRMQILIGAFPSMKQLARHGKYSYSMYYRRLGSGIRKLKTMINLNE